jgi:hypothetical protein
MKSSDFSTTGMRNKGRQSFKENELKERGQIESIHLMELLLATLLEPELP